MSEESPFLASLRCPHGHLFIIRDICDEAEEETRGREPTWRERRRLRRGLKKLLKDR